MEQSQPQVHLQCHSYWSNVPVERSARKLFCSTGLVLASSWWVLSTFSSHSPLSSKQRRWLTSATATIFPLENFWECWELNPGQLGWEASVLPIVLCWYPPLQTTLRTAKKQQPNQISWLLESFKIVFFCYFCHFWLICCWHRKDCHSIRSGFCPKASPEKAINW